MCLVGTATITSGIPGTKSLERKLMKLVAKRLTHFLFLLFIGLSACVSPSPRPLPSPTLQNTPQVAVTAWTALIEGQLVLMDGCLKVVESTSQTAYTLAFPPDFATTVSGDTVQITSDLVTGDHKEALLQIGETVRLGGGVPGTLNDDLRKTVHSTCQGPYWVFGGLPERKDGRPSTTPPASTSTPTPFIEPTDTPYFTATIDPTLEAAYGPLCVNAQRTYFEYDFSPDESWIAAVCFRETGTVDSPLQVVNKDRSKNWKIYFRDFMERPTGYDWHDIIIPYHWSQDGKYLYATAWSRLSGCCWIGGRYILLVRLDLETGEQLELLNTMDISKNYQISFTITDNSNYLLYTPTKDETYDFTILDLRTMEAQTVTLGSSGYVELTYAEMSPDDRYIIMPLFRHVEFNDYDVDTVIKVNRATGEQTTLISGLKPGKEYYPVRFVDNYSVLLSSAKPEDRHGQKTAEFWLLNINTLKMEKTKPVVE